jgi:hypothetical protein
MSRHHGRRHGYFYGCAHNWKRGPAICPNNLHLPQAVLDEAVLDATVLALDAELVDAAEAQAFVRLVETAGETVDRRPILESFSAAAPGNGLKVWDEVLRATTRAWSPKIRSQPTRLAAHRGGSR